MRRRVLGALVVTALLLSAASATAKDFKPGDLRVCAGTRCAAITDSRVLPILGSFYYSGPAPATAPSVRIGAPYYELRFTNGYVTGIVATSRLDRFLSYGVYLGRFQRGTWYTVPPELSSELRRLTVRMKPLRVTAKALAKSH